MLAVGCWASCPRLLLLAILVGSFHNGTGAWALDFNGNFVIPARDILRGVSPYHPAYLERVRDAVAAGHRPDEFSNGVFATYPAPALLIGVPFTYLPAALAEWLWLGLMRRAALALRIVGVRDWRVYGAALLTPRTRDVALVRHRQLRADARARSDLALARPRLARRPRARRADRAQADLPAAARLARVHPPLALRRVACAVAAGSCSAAGRVIGFDGFTGYPHLLSLPHRHREATRATRAASTRTLPRLSGTAWRPPAPYVARRVRRAGRSGSPCAARAATRPRLPARRAGADRVLADRLAALPRCCCSCRSPCCARG